MPMPTPAHSSIPPEQAGAPPRPEPVLETMRDRLEESARFPVREGMIQLNNGSYGCCPAVVGDAQAHLRARLEADPVHFFKRDLERLCDDARAALSHFVGAPPEDLALVPNGTFAVSTVLRNLDLQPGDGILITDHEYMASMNELHALCARTGAELQIARIPFPEVDEQTVIDAVLGAATGSTRVALISHITSASALILPVERIVPTLKSRGVRVILDGAHTPGQIPLDIESLGVDWYAASCHKWLATPKGTGFVYAAPEHQARFKPLALSCRVHETRGDRAPFLCDFDYVGTNDYTGNLVIPVAIEHMGAQLRGGWDALYRRNHELVIEGAAIVREALGVKSTTPESMIGSMAGVPIPGGRVPGSLYDDALWDALYTRHNIQVPVWEIPGVHPRTMRLSAQLYNTIEDFERLAKALRAELR